MAHASGKQQDDEGGAISVRTALIVDDSRVARLALARRLGARGIDVVSVASGADALRKLQDTHPDVIFMDYMMPEMDGLEACRAIVRDPATASIPVIMTTSNDTPEFRKRGISSGARGFLSKGLEDRELDNILDAVQEAVVEMRPTRGAAMEPSRAELDERTLAMVRDQAINAARRASEEYFSGQLPGLEEQVIQVAESAARHVLAGAGGGRTGAAGVDTEALRALEQRVDNLFADKQLRSMVQKMVREERAAMMAIGGAAAPPERSARPGGFGRLLGRLLLVIFLLAVAGAVVLYVFPDTPLASALRAALDALVQRAQQRS